MTQSENTDELSYEPKKNIRRKINSCKEKKAHFVVQISISIRKEPPSELNCKAETDMDVENKHGNQGG